MIESPVFLIASPRSGTTLLRLLLDHHPDIAFHGEFEFAVDWVSDDGDFPNMEQFYGCLSMDRIFRASGLKITPSLDYPALVDDFLAQKAATDGKPIVGATIHRHFSRLLHIWPKARFIHLLRDGRDVARSHMGMGWNGNIWTASQAWLEAEALWDRLEERVPPERRITVRYERLVAQPVACLDEICRFAGTSFHPRMLEIERDTTYSRPDPGLASRWRRTLAKRQIRFAEGRMEHMLTRRGYALSGLRPIVCGRLTGASLQLHCRWRTRLFRLRRFGFLLTLLNAIAHRIGSERLRRRVTLRLQEVTTLHLK